MSEDLLMTANDICKLTKCHRSTLHRWIKKGFFPESKSTMNTRKYWAKSDVMIWIRQFDW